MDCSYTNWISNKEYIRRFREKVRLQRIPLSGGIDLTHRCNLKCVHCFVGPQDNIGENGDKEMDTQRVLSIVDEITDAGCLNFLITGGEPLLRKDFADIYRYAKEKGILVTVFTNATLITEKIAGLFAELPPQTVEISLYGASEATYESITGVAGSFSKCLKGISLLLDHGIKDVRLKTVLMTLNNHEFYEIENMAKKFGLKFRFDAGLFPRFNGDKSPLNLRVPAEEAVEKEFSDHKRLQGMKDFFERYKETHMPETLYNCGAGLTYFHIDPYGMLQPCLMSKGIKYDLQKGSFMDGWNGVINRITDKKAKSGYLCNGCEKRAICSTCPAFFNLENGSEEVHSDYLCAIGGLRYDNINKNVIAGGQYGN